MKFLGLTITRTKALDVQTEQEVAVRTKTILSLAGIDSTRGWWPFGGFHEITTGGWQRNETVDLSTALAHPTVFACTNLIQKDLGKMRLYLAQPSRGDIFVEVENPAYTPVLRKPNHYQTRQRFIETWVNSKLNHGNTIVLKQRDSRTVVEKLYVLDPTKVQILVAPDGSLFYELQADDLGRVRQPVRVPSREIIHDMMPALFHPLVGVSPLYAASAVALQGLTIEEMSSNFFGNGARPGGVLMAPGRMSQESADRTKAYWDAAFTGTNAGKVALLTEGMTYKEMQAASARDSQLIEQSNWIDEKICSCYGVPPHKVGVGDQPNYNNIEALNQQYWSECLQHFAEAIQTLLAEGLSTRPYEVRFDLTGLLQMDTATKVKAASDGIRAGFLAPNEARRMFFDLPPVDGGDTPYMQHQDYSLAALNRRDQAQPAPDSGGGAPAPAPRPEKETTEKGAIVVTSEPITPAGPTADEYARARRQYRQRLLEAASS